MYMFETTLKLALFVSISGLVLLSILAYFIGPPHIELSKLESYNGKNVVVREKITSASHHPKVTFLTLGKENVKVVLFGLPSHKFVAGDVVEVTGDIKYYKGELEIIAEEVRLLNN